MPCEEENDADGSATGSRIPVSQKNAQVPTVSVAANSAPWPGAQQQRSPADTAAAAAAKSSKSRNVLSLTGSCRKRNHLPRSPLASRNDNITRYDKGDGAADLAGLTSSGRRSTSSPHTRPGSTPRIPGPKTPSTRRTIMNTVNRACARGVGDSSSCLGFTPMNTAVATGEASVVSPLDTRQAEQELLAAFSRTPKIRRSPRGGSSRTAHVSLTSDTVEGFSCGRGPAPTTTATPPRMYIEMGEMKHKEGSGEADADRVRQAAAEAVEGSTATLAHVDVHVKACKAAISSGASSESTEPIIAAEGERASSIVSPLGIRQSEQEILAAFSRTPKMRRTPPRGIGSWRVQEVKVVEVSRISAETVEVMEQQGSRDAEPEPAPQAAAAAAPPIATSAATPPHVTAAKGVESEAEYVPASQLGVTIQPRNNGGNDSLPRTQGDVDIQRPPETWAQRAQELALCRENKLARTSSQTTDEESSVNTEKILPVDHQTEAAAREKSEGAEQIAMDMVTLDSTSVANTVVDRDMFERKGREDGSEHTAAAACDGSHTQQKYDHPRFSRPLQQLPPYKTRLERAATGQKCPDGGTEPANAFVGAGSPWRLASPSASAKSGLSAANVNLGSLEENDPTQNTCGGDAAGRIGVCGKMTPAVFKGLVAEMRTPLTGMERSGVPSGKVPAMKSLDLGGIQPQINPGASSQPLVPRLPAAGVRAGRVAMVKSMPYSSSSCEAAAAAKRAAVATAAADTSGSSAKNDGRASSGDICSSADNAKTMKAAANISEVKASGKATPLTEAEDDESPGTRSSGEASSETVDPSRQSWRLPPRTRSGTSGTGLAPRGGQEPTTEVRGAAGIDPPPCTPVTQATPAKTIDAYDVTVEVKDRDVSRMSSSSSSHPVNFVTSVQNESDRDARPSAEGVAIPDPFTRKSELLRTPVKQAVSRLLGSDGGVGTCGASRLESEGQDMLLPVDLRTAQVQVGELRREVACMADRVAKQTDERKRLAEIAFQAQDEATCLKKQLQEIQQKQQQKGEMDGKAGNAVDGLPQLHEETGFRQGEVTGVVTGKAAPSGREFELEIEKCKSETAKREAQEEARHATVALEKALAKVRELTRNEEIMQEERLEEQLRRAREQCKRDEEAMEERQLKAKLFAANTRAEILRAKVLAQDKERTEKSLRAAAVAIAGKARAMVEAFVARNERMAARVACLRDDVKEHEHRVSQLKETSTLLEAAGRSANEETLKARQQLQEAKEGLVAARERATDLETRLGPLESQCREAQSAQEHLRELVTAEGARRASLEQQLSQAKRMSEEVIEMERSRRQSTERRLGAVERARDELAMATVEAAGSAMRQAAQGEKERRLSVERRLGEAVRARDELSETVARTAAVATTSMTAAGFSASTAADISLGTKVAQKLRPLTSSALLEQSEMVVAKESSKDYLEEIAYTAHVNADGNIDTHVGVNGEADTTKKSVECVAVSCAGPVLRTRRASKRVSSSGDSCIWDESLPAKALSQTTEPAGLPGNTKPTNGEATHAIPIPADASATTWKLRQRSKVNYAEGVADSKSTDGEVGAGHAHPHVPARSEGARSLVVPASDSSEASAEEDARSPPCEIPSARVRRVRKKASAVGGLVGQTATSTIYIGSDNCGLPESAGAFGTRAYAGAITKRKKLRRARKTNHRDRGSNDGSNDDSTMVHSRRPSTKMNKSARSRPYPCSVTGARSPEACPVEGEENEDESEKEETVAFQQKSAGKGQPKKVAGTGVDGDGSRGKIPARGRQLKATKADTLSTLKSGHSSVAEEVPSNLSAVVREGRKSTVSQSSSMTDGGSTRSKHLALQRLKTPLEKQKLVSKSGESLMACELEKVEEKSEAYCTNAQESPKPEEAVQKGCLEEANDRGKGDENADDGTDSADVDTDTNAVDIDADPDADVDTDAYTDVEGVAVSDAGPVRGRRISINRKRVSSSGDDCNRSESPSTKTFGRFTGSAAILGSRETPTSSALGDAADVNPVVFVPTRASGTTRKLRPRSEVNYAEGDTGSEIPDREAVARGKSLEMSAKKGVRSLREKTLAHPERGQREVSVGGDLVGPSNTTMNVESDYGGLLESTCDAGNHAAAATPSREVDIREPVAAATKDNKPIRARKADYREQGSNGKSCDDDFAAQRSTRFSPKSNKRARSSLFSSSAAPAWSSEASFVEGEEQDEENNKGKAAQTREKSTGRRRDKKNASVGGDGGDSPEKVPAHSQRQKAAKSVTALTPESGEKMALGRDPSNLPTVFCEGKGSTVSQNGSTTNGDSAMVENLAARQLEIPPIEQKLSSKSGEGLMVRNLENAGEKTEDVPLVAALNDRKNARGLPRTEAAVQEICPLKTKDRSKADSCVVTTGADIDDADVDANSANADAANADDPEGPIKSVAVSDNGLVQKARRASKRVRSSNDGRSGEESSPAKTLSQDTEPSGIMRSTKSTSRKESSQTPTGSTLGEATHEIPVPARASGITRKLRQRSKVDYADGNADSDSSDGEAGAGRARSRPRPRAQVPARGESTRSHDVVKSALSGLLEVGLEKDTHSPRKKTTARAQCISNQAGTSDGLIKPTSSTLDMGSNYDELLESAGDAGDHKAAVVAPTDSGVEIRAPAAAVTKNKKLRRARKVNCRERGSDGKSCDYGDDAIRSTRLSTRSSKSARSHPCLTTAAAVLPSEASPAKGEKREGKAESCRETSTGKRRRNKNSGNGGDSRRKLQARGGRQKAAKLLTVSTPESVKCSVVEGDPKNITAVVHNEKESDLNQSDLRTDSGNARRSSTRLAKQTLGSKSCEDMTCKYEDVCAEGGDTEESKRKREEVPRVAALSDCTNVQESPSIGVAVQEGRPQEVTQSPQRILAAGLREASTSSHIPPVQKRPRKLLGGGASRCKTPKGKDKAANSPSSSSTQDTARTTAVVAVSNDQAAGDCSSGVISRVGVGPRSGRRASSWIQSADGQNGGGKGAFGGASNRAVKIKKRSNSSIFSMRGKPPIRGSLFQGFLDPRKGFIVPKLKDGASRP